MTKKRIELLRGTVNDLIHCSRSYDELLKKSQELDKLIVKSMKIKNFARSVLGDGLKGEFEKVIEKLCCFENSYQSMRVVDPVMKKALDLKENEVSETDLKCYNYWEKEDPCENCISIKAYNEGETYFKLEHDNDKNAIMTAVPIDLRDKRLVVELLKNNTSSCPTSETGSSKSWSRMFSITEHMNQAAVKDKLTGLFNETFVKDRLPVDLLKSAFNNDPLTLVFMRLNMTKDYDNPARNSARRSALQHLGQEMKRHLSTGNEWAARYGNGKFVMSFYNKVIDDARIIAERIRRSIEQEGLNAGQEGKNLSLTVWIHSINSESGYSTFELIMDLADKKLNRHKSRDGDVVCR